MKTTSTNLLMLAAVLSASANAYAYDFEVDGIYYNVNKMNLTCEVTWGMNPYKGNIIIPATVMIDNNTFSVIAISTDAFSGCTELTSITIPNSVINIYDRSFNDCTGLKELIINDGEQSLNLGVKSAYERQGLFYDCQLENVYIGRDLNYNNTDPTIQGDTPMFSPIGNHSLKRAVIGNYVTKIGRGLFRDCDNLATILLGENVTIIDYLAFLDCVNLKYITLPNKITKIGEAAFTGCSSLTNIEMPNSLIEIGIGAFEDTGLISVKIPNNVTKIEGAAFYWCRRLESVEIPNSITKIESSTFYGCNSLTNVKIPSSITEIESDAFGNCSSLDPIIIPKNVIRIGHGAFSGCLPYNTGLRIISLNPIPPTIESNENAFDINIYENAALNIPIGSLGAYQKAEGWKRFKYIKEVDFGGVDGVEEDAVSVSAKDGSIVVSGTDNAMAEVYNLSGQLVYSGTDTVINVPSKGIYIVRVSGQTFKVIL